jgi:hypothetical protein
MAVDPEQFAQHSRYSHPGRHADRLTVVPDDLASVCAAARNVIAHYRADLPDLTPAQRCEVNSRWLEVTLDVDAHRHPAPLTEHRPLQQRVAGCCRDHSLFAVGALRHRGRPARTRVGFAHYFDPARAVDHVVVDVHDGHRWRRLEPELEAHADFAVHDMPTGPRAPFETAAEAWLRWRAGEQDLSTYGVRGQPALSGPSFVGAYVIFEVAHRYGDELLLWDSWGAAADPLANAALVDEVASLLVGADAGDTGAEAELFARYRQDDHLHPGDQVVTLSPFGAAVQVTTLRNGPDLALERMV